MIGFRYTDDPIADAAAYDAELARLEAQVPDCEICNKPVAEDYYYEINDEVICAECMERDFRKEVAVS